LEERERGGEREEGEKRKKKDTATKDTRNEKKFWHKDRQTPISERGSVAVCAAHAPRFG